MTLDVFLSFYSQRCWCLLVCAVTCYVPLLYLVHVIGTILDAQIININLVGFLVCCLYTHQYPNCAVVIHCEA